MNDDSRKATRKAAAAEVRAALIDRLLQEGADDLAAPLQACGQPFPLTCTNCGGIHTVETHCRCRWCPACAPLVSAERAARWGAAIEALQWPLFVTLTIPNSEDPETLRHLRKKWGQFRRRKIIKERVAGGVATFEVTNKGNGWHPHIHAVMDCRWLAIHTPEPRATDSAEVIAEKCRRAQEELTAQWSHMLGVPWSSVWVRRVHGSGVIQEVLKYACKGSELVESPDAIAPMLRVLKQTRTLSGWGSLHPLPSPDEEQKPSVACSDCGAEKSFIPSELAFLYRIDNQEKLTGRTVPPSKQSDH